MSLTPPVPGLRVVNGSHSAQRVEVIVPAGDVLDVSEAVAAQLTAASGAFKSAAVVVDGEETVDRVAVVAAPKRAARPPKS